MKVLKFVHFLVDQAWLEIIPGAAVAICKLELHNQGDVL